MAKRVVDDASLTSVADAIRAKTGNSGQITFPQGFAAAQNDVYQAAMDNWVMGNVPSDFYSEADSVGAGIFSNTAFNSITLPNAETISDYAFAAVNCPSINLPKAKTVGRFGFNSTGAALEELTLPEVTTIGFRSFNGCGIKRIFLPRLTQMGGYTFQSSASLVEISMPSITQLGVADLWGCTALERITLPSLTAIGWSVFNNSTKLTAVILGANTVCTLVSTQPFTNTPILSGTGYIYVPADLVESYKSAANWSELSAQIRAIEDYPEITGGI